MVRIVLLAVVVLEELGAEPGVLELEPDPGAVVESVFLVTGGSAGSTISAGWRIGSGGAASGGFAVTRLSYKLPGLIDNIVNGRLAFGLEHGDSAFAKKQQGNPSLPHLLRSEHKLQVLRRDLHSNQIRSFGTHF